VDTFLLSEHEARTALATAERQPLVVDLDGTLVRTDTVLESLVGALTQPVKLLRALGLLRQGKARLKRELAALAAPDAALLPYNRQLLAYLRTERDSGRPIILATGADRRIALAVADHLDLFDAVLSSDGIINLTGEAKLAAIREALGGRPFTYIGNAHADLPIWRESHRAIVVDASPSVAREAAALAQIEATFDAREPWPKALLRAMRPHQWVKNLLVFVPIMTARPITDFDGWVHAVLMFIAFSCTASGIYIINDLCDLSADRRHPKKRDRAFASGALPIGIGIAAAPLLIAVGLGFSLFAGTVPVLICYAATSVGYSFYFKTQPLVDVFMLAGLYTIRLIGGGLASGYPVSLWLMAFSSFLFLGLALVKRVAELQEIGDREKRRVMGRGYRPGDVRVLETMGIAAAFVTSMVLALYVQSELVVGVDRRATLAWAIVPLMLMWQCRIWLATSRGRMHHDPIVFAARDWVSWLVAVCSFGVLLLGNKISLFAL